jgi:TPR repeat protein
MEDGGSLLGTGGMDRVGLVEKAEVGMLARFSIWLWVGLGAACAWGAGAPTTAPSANEGMSDAQVLKLTRDATLLDAASFDKLKAAAQGGNPAAMYCFGWLNARGEKLDEALKWYGKAAASDQSVWKSSAQRELAVMYWAGRGVKEDPLKALTLMREAATAGNVEAMTELADRLETGRGVDRDAFEASRWLTALAEAPELTPRQKSQAMFKLGLMFENGIGVVRDDAKAVEWLKKAADADNDKAMTELGRVYAQGRGVKRDDAEAARWYARAAKYDDVAARELGLMYLEGRGVAQNDEHGAELLEKAARHDPEAMYQVSKLYAAGRGVPKDKRLSLQWLDSAAKAGVSEAEEWMKQHPGETPK